MCECVCLQIGVTRSGPRLSVGVLLLELPRQQNFFGGHTLDLVLKVPGYHREWGKKEKTFAPGVHHVMSTANVKKRRSRHLYKGKYGKSTKNSYFCRFSPSYPQNWKKWNSLSCWKFCDKNFPKNKFFQKSDFYIIMTS